MFPCLVEFQQTIKCTNKNAKLHTPANCNVTKEAEQFDNRQHICEI
jgi:hypothetical protein